MGVRICFVLPGWADGGVERVVLLLLQELARREYQTDLVLLRPKLSRKIIPLEGIPLSTRMFVPEGKLPASSASSRFQEIPYSKTRLVKEMAIACLHDRHNLSRARAISVLASHFEASRPSAVVGAEYLANISALLAAPKLAGFPVVCSLHSSVRRWRRKQRAQAAKHLRKAGKVVTVSGNTAKQVIQKFLLPRDAVVSFGNPISIPSPERLSGLHPPNHDWYQKHDVPIVVCAGRLHPDKDLPTSLRAFQRLRESRDARLVVMGTGKPEYAAQLKRLARELEVGPHVEFVGFQTEPDPWIRHADLLVLSSEHEAFGLCLAEALALGTQVVSTDTPEGGPAEILEGGAAGKLVPVGDHEQMAVAMRDALLHPVAPEVLRASVERYSLPKVTDRYLACMGLA